MNVYDLCSFGHYLRERPEKFRISRPKRPEKFMY